MYVLLFLLNIGSLKIADLHRREYIIPVETIFIGEDTEIAQLVLDNISVENHTTSENIPLFINNGVVKKLKTSELYNDWIKENI